MFCFESTYLLYTFHYYYETCNNYERDLKYFGFKAGGCLPVQTKNRLRNLTRSSEVSSGNYN